MIVASATLLAAAPASAAPRQDPAAKPGVIAVWAMVDGDTPLAGAHVRVVAADGRALGAGERTSAGGASLIEAQRLPATFTVEVTPRTSLGGSFRAVVHHYTSGSVVYVDPVTTLVADNVAAHRHAGHPLSVAAAHREVYRLLRIPDWQNQADLSHSDRYFDGDAYLRSAHHAGGVAALNHALVRDALQHDHHAFPDATQAARAAGIDWIGLLGNPTKLIAQAFKSLALYAGATLKTVASHKAGETVLGWVLAAFGLGEEELDNQDMEEVKHALDALGMQLTQLQGRVELAGFSDLVHQTDRSIGEIDYASNQLALLAGLPASDPTKAKFAETIRDYIGAHLLDEPEILNQDLGTNVPLADNLIKSASRVVSTRDRFFDVGSSEEVRSVYEYFAAYQAKLALLLTEYYHAKPDTFSAEVVTKRLAQIESNVAAQAASLKPPVPAGTVVDTKTGLMWMQRIDGSPLRKLSDLLDLEYHHHPDGDNYIWRLKKAATSTSLPGLPFDDWGMPSQEELHTLLSSWNHSGVGGDYLVREAHMSKPMLDAGTHHVFMRDGFSTGSSVFGAPLFHYNLYSLKDDVKAAPGTVGVKAKLGSTVGFFTEDHSQAILYRRERASGEDYWWGGTTG